MKRIALALAAFIAVCASVETGAILTGTPTISAQVQRFAADNLQVWTFIVAVVWMTFGWLLAHFASRAPRATSSELRTPAEPMGAPAAPECALLLGQAGPCPYPADHVVHKPGTRGGHGFVPKVVR